MATVATDILSVAEAKESLDIPTFVTDRDSQITTLIAMAVGYISTLNGVPLIDGQKEFELNLCSTLVARIVQPPSWPIPREISHISYRTDPDVATHSVVATDRSGAEYSHDLGIIVRPVSFGITEFDFSWIDPMITVAVGVDTASGVPPALKGAVMETVRALYNGDPVPRNVQFLVNGSIA